MCRAVSFAGMCRAGLIGEKELKGYIYAVEKIVYVLLQVYSYYRYR